MACLNSIFRSSFNESANRAFVLQYELYNFLIMNFLYILVGFVACRCGFVFVFAGFVAFVFMNFCDFAFVLMNFCVFVHFLQVS